MDNSAAFSFSEGSVPFQPNEPTKSHDPDFDLRRSQEIERQKQQSKFDNLKQQIELANRNLEGLHQWYECTRQAKQDVQQTDEEIAQLRHRIDRIRHAAKRSAFCQKINPQKAEKLTTELKSIAALNLDVIQHLKSWGNLHQ